MKNYIATACFMVTIAAESEAEAKQIVESNINNCLEPFYMASTAMEIKEEGETDDK